MNVVLIVDADLGAALGDACPAALRVAPVLTRPRRRAKVGGCDAIVALLADTSSPVIVLSRATSDGPLEQIARALECDVLRVTDHPDGACWVVTMAGALSSVAHAPLVRVLEVLAGGPGGVAADAPRRTWGSSGVAVPALRPATLARWAERAWSPCSWCDRGGLPGRACCRCGAMVPSSEAA